MRRIWAFLVAVIVTYLLIAITYTQLNLANLVEMGVALSFEQRLSAAGHDLVSMAPLFTIVIVLAFLIGFPLAGLAARFVPQLRRLAYIVAGFVSLFAVDLAMQVPFGTHMVPTTRTLVGLLVFCVAGAVGAYVFVSLTPERASDKDGV